MLRRLAIMATLTLMALGPFAALATEPKPETEQQAQRRLAKTNYARGGYYFGMEGLAAIENTEIIGGLDRYIVSGGFHGRVGHRHNRWTATELMALYVHTFGGDVQFLPPFGALNGSFLAWGMYANERVYLTKARFQPFISAGLGFLQIRSKEDFAFLLNENGLQIVATPNDALGFSMLFSAGMEMYKTESVVFTLQANYHMQFGNIDDTDFITAGLGMQFF